MGWCSATEIMDTALDAAEKAARAALAAHNNLEPDEVDPLLEEHRARLDEALRPFVASLAERLRADDWDCVDESRHFDRFRQEMLGHTDSEHRAWLAERVKDSDGDEKWATALLAHIRKMEAKINGG